jgi:hypothetical protein
MKKGSLEAKAVGALIAALLFYIVGSGPVYGLVDKVVAKVSGKSGHIASKCKVGPAGKQKEVMRPTKLGRVVHTLVFGLVVLLLLEL